MKGDNHKAKPIICQTISQEIPEVQDLETQDCIPTHKDFKITKVVKYEKKYMQKLK